MLFWVFFIGLVLSVLLIWKGSALLTDSLVPVAHQLGTSYIAVTTLLVSVLMGTPELFSSIYSLLLDHPDIGLGVFIGSVMTNIGLATGISAALHPLKVEKDIVIRDGFFLISVVAMVMVFGSDLQYTRSEGIVLILMFIPYILNVWYFEGARPTRERKDKVESIKKNLQIIGNNILEMPPSLLTFVLGGLLLLGGSYLFSFSMVEIGRLLSLPDLLVGVIFGGLGTGIPNIAAAIQATRSGYKDAAITETFGSNTFTLMVTLGIFIIIQPFAISNKVFYFDLLWMIAIHILLISFIIKGYRYKEESLTRVEGSLLFLLYVVLLFINVVFF